MTGEELILLVKTFKTGELQKLTAQGSEYVDLAYNKIPREKNYKKSKISHITWKLTLTFKKNSKSHISQFSSNFINVIRNKIILEGKKIIKLFEI